MSPQNYLILELIQELNKETHKVEIDPINEQIDPYLKEHKVDRNTLKIDNICPLDGEIFIL